MPSLDASKTVHTSTPNPDGVELVTGCFSTLEGERKLCAVPAVTLRFVLIQNAEKSH